MKALRLRALAVLFVTTANLPSASGQSGFGVFTQQYSKARTGSNLYEKILTPNNVGADTFGKLFSFTVDGQVYAQPLFVSGVNIPGQGIHNVAYSVTQMDSVFAFDADTGVQLWQDNFTDPANGIVPVPCDPDYDSKKSCGVYPYYGITGTPVIDGVSQTMYLVARTYNLQTGAGYQNLHALDITTGAEKFGGPVEIQGSVPGTGNGSVNGMVPFDELNNVQRAALLLQNNNRNGRKTVYIGWTGNHGWILAYDAQTLQQTGILCTTPNARLGGVWQAGNGLAADDADYIYTATGDGRFDADSDGPDYGDSLLKLDGDLNVVDYFTPMDQACRYKSDFDLASSGPILLPTQSGPYPDEVVQSGKGGSPCDSSGFAPIYLADRDDLGKFNPKSDNVIQEITGTASGYWSSPAFWSTGTQSAIYYAGVVGSQRAEGDYLKMYTLTDGLLSNSAVSQSSNEFPIGATPSASGNGENNGIVWATLRHEGLSVRPGQLPATLYAYDATNLATMFYNSAENPLRDQGGCANKFQVPVVANGKVYVGTQNQVDVFGLLSLPAPLSLYLSRPCFTFSAQAVGTTSQAKLLTLRNTGQTDVTVQAISIRGLNASEFEQTNTCPQQLPPNQDCLIRITFAPAAVGARVAQVMIQDNAPGNPHNAAVTGQGTQ